jgi:hypothetical protein
MASAVNVWLKRFNSCFHKPGVEAVDCLSQNWRQDNNWVVPLIALILKIVSLIRRQWAPTTIIVLVWEGKQWFQDLMEVCSDELVPILSNQQTFVWDGRDLPEPLRNPRWCWVACRTFGSGARTDGLAQHSQRSTAR